MLVKNCVFFFRFFGRVGYFFLDSSNVSVWFSLFLFIELIFIVVLVLGIEDVCFSSGFYERGGE